MLTGRVRLSGAATCVVAIVLGMTGCFASTPDPTPSASAAPSAPPLFASDEEALAAATEAYTAYLAVGSEVARDGGLRPERMAQVTLGEAYEQELSTFTSMADSGQHGQGTQTFDSASLQSANLTTGDVSVYLCLDTSETQIVDEDGEFVGDADRVMRFPLEVDFTRQSADDRQLLVESSDSWMGANFC